MKNYVPKHLHTYHHLEYLQSEGFRHHKKAITKLTGIAPDPAMPTKSGWLCWGKSMPATKLRVFISIWSCWCSESADMQTTSRVRATR
jgi:hypothetical protein